jgi:hypothetical protein
VEAEVKRKMVASIRAEYLLRTIDPPSLPGLRNHVAPKRSLYAAVGGLLALALAGLLWLDPDLRRRISDRLSTRRLARTEP